MKKSTLSTLIASLFTVAIAGTAVAKAGHDKELHEERKMVKIQMDHQNEGPVNFEIDIDGNHHVFEFTQEELNDQDAIAAKLADVDEQTRQTVMDALGNLNAGPGHIVFHHNGEHDGDMVKKKFVVLNGSEGVDSETIIELAENGNFTELHKVVESHSANSDGKKGPMVFKFGHGAGMKLHTDSGHSLKVIKKLIKNGDLTQEQLDEIQLALDEKR